MNSNSTANTCIAIALCSLLTCSGLLHGQDSSRQSLDEWVRSSNLYPPGEEDRVRSTWLSSEDLAIFNDPAFKKRFALSYISETEIEPKVDEDERELIIKIMDLISEDDLAGAESLILESKEEGSSAMLDFFLGNIYLQTERFTEATQAYQSAVEKYPRFRRAWRNLGLAAIQDVDFDAAIPAFTEVISLGGGDVQSYGLLGMAYSRVDDHISAETAFRMAILLDPVTVNWKLGMAMSLFMQERYASTAALVKTLLKDDPENAKFWMIQANAFIGLGEFMKAAENFEIVDQLGQSTHLSLCSLADIYMNEELYELGVDSYTKAIVQFPESSPARPIRACKMLVARGANDEAGTLIDQLDAVKGSDLEPAVRTDLLKIRARIAAATDQSEESAKILRQIVEINPLDGDALILLGNHCKSEGDVEQAIFYYQRAEGLEEFEADAKLQHAQLLVDGSRYQEAIPLLRRVHQLTRRKDVQDYLETVEWFAKNR